MCCGEADNKECVCVCVCVCESVCERERTWIERGEGELDGSLSVCRADLFVNLLM